MKECWLRYLGPLHALFFLTLLLLRNLPCTALVAQSAPELLDRLSTAARLSTLFDPTLKPWHLKIDFDLLAPKGAVHEHGTFEEAWAAPDPFPTTMNAPGYTATETHNGLNVF